MSSPTTPIRTPLSRLLMLWRQRYLPVGIWGAAVILAVVLIQRQQVFIDAVGLVEAQTTLVAPLLDGTVQSLAVDVLDPVEAGQVLVLMDDTLIRAELMVAEAELNRVRAALDAEQLRFVQEQQVQQASVQNDQRRFVLNEETARLDYLDRVIQHETDKVNLQRLQVQLKRQEEMVKQHILDDAAFDETRLAYEALRTKVEKDVNAIALAEKNMKTATQRRDELGPIDSMTVAADAILKSLQADIAAQQARVQEVQDRRQALALKAPVTGQVALISRRPGESMLAGEPVLTIVGDGGNRVMAYVDERASFQLSAGDSVELHSRTHPSTVVRGTILKVGAHIEPFPLRLLANPLMPQHGFQVLVGELPENAFRVGEALDLRLRLAS